MLRIISVSPEKQEQARKDGKASRKYITVKFIDPSNPFLNAQRNFFQQHSADGSTAFWKGLDPSGLAAFTGKDIEGNIKDLKVIPYSIGEGDAARTVDTYKAVVLANETDAQVARAANHELAGISVTSKEELAA